VSSPSQSQPLPRASALPLRRAVAAYRRNLTTIVVGVIVVLLVVPPVATVIYSGFTEGLSVWHGTRTFENYRTVLGEAGNFSLIRNSLVFAAGSAILAVAFATVVAFLIERTNAAFRAFVYLAAIMSLGVPIVVQVMGWLLLLGPNAGVVNTLLREHVGEGVQIDPYSMPVMIFVQATITFPALLLLVAPAFRLADPGLEQAAAVSGATRPRILATITLPLVLPSVLAALLLGFIIGLESFEVPALIGTPAHLGTIATAIYAKVNDQIQPQFGVAGAFSTLLMLFTLFGLWGYQRVTARGHRYATVTGKGYRPDKLDLRGFRWPSSLLTLLVPLTVLAPILILLWSSFLKYYAPPSTARIADLNLGNYRGVLGDPTFTSAVKNTVLLGVGAALIVMMLSVFAAWALIRRRSPLSRSIDQLGSLPIVVPGVVLSLAMLQCFINFPVPIYNTMWLILLAFVVHYLPYGLRYGHGGLISVHNELEEAADVAGSGRIRVFRTIVLPLLAPTLLAGGLFIFMASVRQLSLVIFLSGPNLNVVSSWIWYIWNNGAITNAAAASTVVVAPILIAAVLFYRLTGIGRGSRNAGIG
jgi:iron(III) transport system permease protein